MRPLSALLSLALLSFSLLACADAGKGSRSPSKTGDHSVSSVRNIGDDHDGDNDNELVRSFGHEATAADTLAVTALVKRYYAAALAANGATACSLIYSTFANSIAEEYGKPSGPPGLRGDTCAAVLSKLFKQEQKKLSFDAATMKVSTVRVKGDEGLVMLYFTSTRPERYLAVRREGNGWKMDNLLDNRLP